MIKAMQQRRPPKALKAVAKKIMYIYFCIKDIFFMFVLHPKSVAAF